MSQGGGYKQRGLPISLVAIDYYSWVPDAPGDEDWWTPKLACSKMRHAAAYAGAPVPRSFYAALRESSAITCRYGAKRVQHTLLVVLPHPYGKPSYATDDGWSFPFSTSELSAIMTRRQ